MPRLTFFKDSEIELFDFPPRFNEEEKSRYFILPDNEIKFRKTETKIGYILQEGYFVSKKKFFLPEHYPTEDVDYVAKLLGINREIDIRQYYHKDLYSIHKKNILNRNGYHSFSKRKSQFAKEASELVKTSLKPREIFDALLDYLNEKRIEIPRYYVFADVITKALNLFENSLIDIIDQTLTGHQKEILDHFMYLPVDSHQPPSTKNPYLLTQLKNVEQSVTPMNIKQSLEDFHQIKSPHEQFSDFFKSDVISNELINYYAIWVIKAEHIQFDAIDDIGRKRLYALSFITWQYKIRQDYSKVLSDIRYCTEYISSFTHYNRKNIKSSPSDESFYGAIIAMGCNIGVRKMGKITDGMTAERLEYIVRWFCSKKNIDQANRKIISLINSLPLSGIYLENQEKLNTSSDGQKFDVTIPSLHASHSPKYFGTGKGVSVYSFIDEKDRLFHNKVISASERESGFVLDGLFHNEDSTTSDTHSTDTHGYSETVFGICYLLDVQFAPRIKNYQEQLLYTFKDKSRKIYENIVYKILPAKSSYINEGIIIEQWDRILRLLCTIKLKETLPSNILKRLSSYSKQNPLYKAIKEVGRIYKTIFLLKYYDEVHLRQRIEKQLNRIELSHHFAKTVFFGNNQELKYATKEEQEIAIGCRHLIQNAIILWNYLFISEKLSQITNHVELQKQINLLKNSSMMSWQHINLHGKYDFDIEVNTTPFDMTAAKSLNIN